MATDVDWRVKFGFVTLPIAHSAGFNVVTLLAFRFFTDNLAISAAAAGFLFAIVKVYDGLLDPAVGAWTDRFESRWGRRLPFVAAGGVMMVGGVLMIFSPPDIASPLLLQIFLGFALLLHASGYTALTIPGLAMLVEASKDYHVRTSLMAWRVFGNSIGVVIGSTMPALLLVTWGAGRQGHTGMSMIVAGAVALATVLTLLALANAPRTVPDDDEAAERYRLKDQIKLAWDNHPFRLLAFAHMFVLAGTAVTSAAGAYFTRYVLELPDSYLGSYYMVAMIGSVATMPAWVWFSRKAGKKSAYITAMASYGLMHLLWFTATKGEAIELLGLRALLTGVAAGGMILTSYSMMTDAVRFDYIRSGLRREGAFAGFTTLLDKLSAAAGIALMGFFLQYRGYAATTQAADASQPESAVNAILICLTIVPFVAMLCAGLIVSRYKLSEADLVEPDPA
ncbi:MAG: MFS transporter [Sphingorhabdus sp.]